MYSGLDGLVVKHSAAGENCPWFNSPVQSYLRFNSRASTLTGCFKL